ncbi:MAG: hypothetical protein ACI4KG_07615 [Oscillospiraceae bacterium]
MYTDEMTKYKTAMACTQEFPADNHLISFSYTPNANRLGYPMSAGGLHLL